MKKQIISVFAVILVAALVLAGSTFALKGVAEANAQAEQLRVMQALVPGGKTFAVEEYTGEDANIRTVYKTETGFVVETATYGYAGEIIMLVGVNNKGTVTGLVVKDMSETWGLGGEGLTDWQFLGQFLYGDGDVQVGTDVDALTGATVTSKAIARSVKSAVAVVTGADADSGATSWGG